VIVFAGLVSGALLASGAIELYFSYYEPRRWSRCSAKALGVADRIDAYIKEIERQISWTTQPQLGAPSAAMYQRRVDYLRLLRQVLPITEIGHLDAEGRAAARLAAGDGRGRQRHRLLARAEVSRGQGRQDLSRPRVLPKESEPYMTHRDGRQRKEGASRWPR
jgi:hypothetical protein